jgi:hypothetical protein
MAGLVSSNGSQWNLPLNLSLVTSFFRCYFNLLFQAVLGIWLPLAPLGHQRLGGSLTYLEAVHLYQPVPQGSHVSAYAHYWTTQRFVDRPGLRIRHASGLL